MAKSRRQFLKRASASVVATVVGCRTAPQKNAAELPPGAPSAFGTSPDAGPPVTASTFADAEKLMQVSLTPAEREQAAGNWRNSLAPVYERRTGPKKVSIESTVAPATRWDPVLPGQRVEIGPDVFVASKMTATPLPDKDEDIAYAPVTHLAQWIQSRKLTSERLTRIYLDRIDRFDPKLHCVITLRREPALAEAKQADLEIASGKYRGPLHGIPWGAKDLLDTRASRPLTAPSPFAIEFPLRMLRWSSGCAKPAPF